MERLKELGFVYNIIDAHYIQYSKQSTIKNNSVNYNIIVSKYYKDDYWNLLIKDNDTNYEVNLIKNCTYKQVKSLVNTIDNIEYNHNPFIGYIAMNDSTVDSFHTNTTQGYFALSNNTNFNHIKMTGFNSDICMICNTDHKLHY